MLALSVFTGCAGARHTLHLGDTAQANRQFAGRAVTVVLTTGAAYPAEALRFAPDSTSWVDPGTGDLLSAPTSGIFEIRHRDRRRAVGRATGRTAIGGAIGGGIALGLAGYDSGGCLIFCSGEPTSGERAEAAVVFGLTGALLGAAEGAVLGLIVGAVSDPTDTFVVQAPVEGRGETTQAGEPAPSRGVALSTERPD